MSPPLVAVTGTGAFSAALVRALARHPHPLRLHVLSRDADRARDLADLARDHAFLAGTPAVCTAGLLDLRDPDRPRRLLAALRPDVLVVAGSEQSPAEGRAAPSAWTDLLARAGFGLTLPLQAGAARTLAAACAEGSPAATVVNACFPDAVNPLLHSAGLPVTCGLGNVATLAAALSARLALSDQQRLHLLAHHAHLHAPAEPADDARGWLDGSPIADLPSLLGPVRSRPRPHLNEVGAAAGAAVVAALAGAGPDHAGHLPGPNGLPGGYPVTVGHREVRLRLPDGLPRERAVAWNLRRAELDGVVVGVDGTVWAMPAALAALRAHWPDAPRTYGPRDLDSVRDRLLRLRGRLRTLPALPPAESTHHHDLEQTDPRRPRPATLRTTPH
ncbi:hypothetical protein AMK16_01685 [Streptomyces sp. CB00455]|uniref:hypothetical protein n=1 Tax=Streptomyces sp. CB00455 TaxID=1703927 RepID=UPI00093AC507|nr:hypothetical protein [Streptomyces sp. CB00455]OKK21980.1 hypothetical protein AMK16_01685 [Streptomyces sp. CB00455]